jgi:two-component system sensor histidine kinase ChiS
MAVPPVPPPPPPPGSANKQGPAVVPARPRILVVEDDEDLLRMMYRMLSTIADVAMAADGEHAMQILLQAGPLPQLLITDWMMPKKDGLTLVREMKAHDRLKNIPVVLLTAKSAPRDVIAGINSGARHYLTKPFKPDDLISKVKKVLKL